MKPRTEKIGLALVAAALAGFHAHANRYVIGPDGISYLDLGSAFMRGDWSSAISSYWGPAYSVLIGAAVRLTRATGLAQFAVAHYVNFLFFTGDLAIFVCFWCKILSGLTPATRSRLERPATVILFLVFIVLFVPMTEDVNPDLLLTGVIFGVAYFLWNYAETQKGRWLVFTGVVFGFGYLVKAIMLPVGTVTLLVIAAVPIMSRRNRVATVSAVLCFVLVCAPLLFVLSKRAGHITAGDTGRLAYVWYVTDADRRATELLVTPGPTINISPIVLRVETRPHVTFGPWFDPASVSKDLHPKFRLENQTHVILASLRMYRDEILSRNPFLLMCVVLLWVANASTLRVLPRPGYWPLIAFVSSPLIAYAMILVQGRYIYPFEFVIWLVVIGLCLNCVREAEIANSYRILLVTCLFLVIQESPNLLSYVRDATRSPQKRVTTVADASFDDAKIARELQSKGFVPGDKVAVVGDPFKSYWVKLVEGSVSAYVPAPELGKLCNSSEATEKTIASTGATWIVAPRSRTECAVGNWYFVQGAEYMLRRVN